MPMAYARRHQWRRRSPCRPPPSRRSAPDTTYHAQGQDYSRLKATHGGKNGSCIESPAFKAGGHAWRLHLYLNGAKEEDAGFVSLHLCLSDAAAAAAGTIVHADFELALVHHQGTLVRWSSSYGVSAIRPFSPETPWGCQRFISVEHLERSMFLKDDCFAVR